MKRTISIFKFFCAAFILFISNVNAQFSDALIGDFATGVSPVFANNTGNFVLQSSGVTYAVNVWDDFNSSNSALSWKVGSSTGNVVIDPNSNVVDPDVCLVKNGGGIIFAVVAYYDLNGNQFLMRVFNWNTASQQFIGNTPVFLSGGQYHKTINVDAGDLGDFAIVWDEPGEEIKMTYGRTIGAQPPTLTFPGSVLTLESGSMPDVCFFRDNLTGYKQVDVAYVNFDGYVIVDFYNFADLLAGVQNTIPFFRSGLPDLIFNYPRIDCPAPGNGSSVDFTVVVEDTDNASSWYIKGFNSNACCPDFSYRIYNDGSTGNSPFNLTDVPNNRPVVTYENFADAILVGWTIDNSIGLLATSGATIAKFPIILSLDKSADIYQAAQYLNVPPVISFGSQISNLSLSGKFNPEGLFTYFNESVNEVYYKFVPHTLNPGNLRAASENNFQLWLNEVSLAGESTNGSAHVNLTVTDMTGRKVFHYIGKGSSLANEWKSFSENAPTALYAGRSRNSNGIPEFAGKILITE